MKLADLEKNKGSKIQTKMQQSATPGRFGADANVAVDRREQRRRDQALGLVPFAVKLDSALVKQIHALVSDGGTQLNDVVAELLKKGLENK
ncbi:MAG: hypothetical protein M3Q00_14245 [Pseudomonadota bacterium]|nr:hypothetical protein [Pseudomonadota bacterium]